MVKPLVLVAITLALGACATPHQLDSDVATYSQWPAGRQAASYAFERLPSQQAQPERQQALEDAARRAVEAAGFTPAADAASADVSVQLGARVTATERSPYDDPFWWRGSLVHPRYRGGPWWPGFGFGFRSAAPVYEREVAVLVRDRQSGQALYEAHASNDGNTTASATLLAAMFEAALKDFPSAAVNPRRVTVDLAR
jgi:hypothetical protein